MGDEYINVYIFQIFKRPTFDRMSLKRYKKNNRCNTKNPNRELLFFQILNASLHQINSSLPNMACLEGNTGVMEQEST